MAQALHTTTKLEAVQGTQRYPNGGHMLDISGAILQVREHDLKEDIFVILGQKLSLSSKRACEELHLLIPASDVFTVDEENDFRGELPDQFEGLGCLKTDYRIQIAKDAKPVCLYTARHVPHSLLGYVQKELGSMEEQGDISPRQKANGMVLWHGLCSESKRPCQDLCQSHSPQLVIQNPGSFDGKPR